MNDYQIYCNDDIMMHYYANDVLLLMLTLATALSYCCSWHG